MEKETKQSGFKSVLSYIYRGIFLPGCGIFSAIVVILMLMLKSVYDNPAIPSRNVFIVFAFSLTFSLSNQILKIKSLNKFLRLGLHFVLSTSTIAFFFLVLNKHLTDIKIGAAVVFLIAYIAVYLIILPIYLFVSSSAERKQREQKEYKNIYKK